jgi:hypothetical protein
MGRGRVLPSNDERKRNHEQTQIALANAPAPQIFSPRTLSAQQQHIKSFEGYVVPPLRVYREKGDTSGFHTDLRRRYCRDVLDRVEPLKVLVDFCDSLAIGELLIKSWLTAFVVESIVAFMTLEPVEWVLRRTVNSMSTCITAWRHFCGGVDGEYLAPYRTANPHTGRKYQMRFSTASGESATNTITGAIGQV